MPPPTATAPTSPARPRPRLRTTPSPVTPSGWTPMTTASPARTSSMRPPPRPAAVARRCRPARPARSPPVTAVPARTAARCRSSSAARRWPLPVARPSRPDAAPAPPPDRRAVLQRPHSARPGPHVTGAGGAVSGTGTLAIRLRGDADGEVRIVGAYPPPLVPAVPADLDALLARPPRVTRYGRHRRRRPRTAVAWSATSVVLAAA